MKWPEIYEPGSKALLKAWELAPIQFPEELVGIPSFKRKWNRPLSWGESQIVIRTTTGFATLQQTSLWQKLVSQSAGQILQLIEGGKVPDNKQFLFWETVRRQYRYLNWTNQIPGKLLQNRFFDESLVWCALRWHKCLYFISYIPIAHFGDLGDFVKRDVFSPCLSRYETTARQSPLPSTILTQNLRFHLPSCYDSTCLLAVIGQPPAQENATPQ